jgi:hypothetical protein
VGGCMEEEKAKSFFKVYKEYMVKPGNIQSYENPE